MAKSIDEVHRVNREKYRRVNEGRGKGGGILFSLIAVAIVSRAYWSFSDSPLITGAFIGFLLCFFTLTVPSLLRMTKLKKSKPIAVASVLAVTAVTYFIVSAFVG